MWNDPIVEEVHAIRRQLLKNAGGDIHELIRLAQQARKPNRKVFHGEARRPDGWHSVAHKTIAPKP
jgi:hypothetical protein